jgi:hypothetical protein
MGLDRLQRCVTFLRGNSVLHIILLGRSPTDRMHSHSPSTMPSAHLRTGERSSAARCTGKEGGRARVMSASPYAPALLLVRSNVALCRRRRDDSPSSPAPAHVLGTAMSSFQSRDLSSSTTKSHRIRAPPPRSSYIAAESRCGGRCHSSAIPCLAGATTRR